MNVILYLKQMIYGFSDSARREKTQASLMDEDDEIFPTTKRMLPLRKATDIDGDGFLPPIDLMPQRKD